MASQSATVQLRLLGELDSVWYNFNTGSSAPLFRKQELTQQRKYLREPQKGLKKKER